MSARYFSFLLPAITYSFLLSLSQTIAWPVIYIEFTVLSLFELLPLLAGIAGGFPGPNGDPESWL
jgi:hypothetical protein